MSKPKYIDANKVIDYANQEVTAAFYYPQDAQEQRKLDEQAHRDKWAFVKQVMVGMPAADVVEVVRCKDCQYRYVLNRGESSICNLLDAQNNGEAYCSYGERKDG